MKAINEETGHNLELQSIILNTIKDFKSQKANPEQSMAALVDNTVTSRKKRKDSESSDDVDKPPKKKAKSFGVLPPAGAPPLPRGQMVVADWSLRHMKELLSFVDDDVDVVGLGSVNKKKGCLRSGSSSLTSGALATKQIAVAHPTTETFRCL